MSTLTAPVLCLGCAMPEHSAGGMVHRCAGPAPLVPYGFCQCPQPKCGAERAPTPYRGNGRTAVGGSR